MKFIRSVFALISAFAFFLAGQSGAAFAQGDQDATRLAQGIKAHDAINSGDDSQIGSALKLLGPEGWARPNLALGYHGSVVTLAASKAKKDGKLADALRLIDEGTQEIDEAVRRDPSAIALRILRMENSIALVETSPVDRKAFVSTDIAALQGRWGELDADSRAVVDLDSGRLSLVNKKISEALASWRKAIKDAPDSDAAKRAKKLIARYGD